jgi:pimeloyl-ACP methyl ester carboxylesterase
MVSPVFDRRSLSARVDVPETRYARSGDVNIAYQVIGDGPFDLVCIPGFVSNLDMMWQNERHARFMRGLASFARVIVFDKRGTGLSDRVPIERLPTLEQRMDDVRAVMDTASSTRAALFGHSEGSVMSILFAATYPDRATALITYGAFAKRIRTTPGHRHSIRARPRGRASRARGELWSPCVRPFAS